MTPKELLYGHFITRSSPKTESSSWNNHMDSLILLIKSSGNEYLILLAFGVWSDSWKIVCFGIRLFTASSYPDLYNILIFQLGIRKRPEKNCFPGKKPLPYPQGVPTLGDTAGLFLWQKGQVLWYLPHLLSEMGGQKITNQAPSLFPVLNIRAH